MKHLSLNFAVALIALAWSAPGLSADADAPAATKPAPSATAVFSVKGMLCPVNCPVVLAEELKKIKGVTDCKVDFEKCEAQVSYDSAIVKPKDVPAALKGSKYTLELPKEKEEKSK